MPPQGPLPELDLAFSVDAALPEALLSAGGDLTDPEAGSSRWHLRLLAWLEQLGPELPPDLRAAAYSLGLALVTDAEIAALNQDWREKAGPTDVLAFAAQDAPCEGTPPMPLPAPQSGQGLAEEAGTLELGDIVISVETAGRQARDHGHELEQELLFLASHGLLHLLGWDHPDDDALTVMLARQDALLAAPVQPG
ncbi:MULTISPECIES: rRNA maturation RNase YbeY [Aphanothece]|uniref:rRNA maturation RNase YbeY n=1 Tax=Aphanothece TaxID=1121 RepID=UPI0039854B92